MDAGIFLTACAENRVEDIAEMAGAVDDALRLQALKIARLSGAKDVVALLETVSEPAAPTDEHGVSVSGESEPAADAAKKEQALRLLGVLRALAARTSDRDSMEPDPDAEHVTPEQLIDPERKAALQSLPETALEEQPLAEALFLYRQSSLMFDLTEYDKAVDLLTALGADRWFLHWVAG